MIIVLFNHNSLSIVTEQYKTNEIQQLPLLSRELGLKGGYGIGCIGKTASISMLTLFESRYTLKGTYNIGNVGKTASISMLTLFVEGKVQHW